MIVAVADTHAALWYLFPIPRLGEAASAFIDEIDPNRALARESRRLDHRKASRNSFGNRHQYSNRSPIRNARAPLLSRLDTPPTPVITPTPAIAETLVPGLA